MNFEFTGTASEDNEYDAIVVHGDEVSVFNYYQRHHPENCVLKVDKQYKITVLIEEVGDNT